MDSIQSNKINLNKKKILLRLDLNVPLKNGKITDTNRIDKVIPTIQFLLKKNSKIIIVSHVGRPKGKNISYLSLKPVCEIISKKIGQKVFFIDKNLKTLSKEDVFKNDKENIIMLENIRFYEGEEKNDKEFGKKLASFGEIYVNDAFSCSHRSHASLVQIPNLLPSFCGLQMNSEINALKKITSQIEKPITCIIGGSKISTKIDVINNLIKKFDNIVFVGGMANTILKFQGIKIGKSIHEENCDSIIRSIFSYSKEFGCKILLPKDVITSKDLDGKGSLKSLDKIEENDMMLDIGPLTIKEINKIIDISKTVLWNGPAGYFENPNFEKGSLEIAKKISKNTKENKIYSVAGGGDTVAVINKYKMMEGFNFVSTAGGAFLEFLEGKVLPGIKALE